MVAAFVDTLSYFLPVFLPGAMTALSIMVRLAAGRIELSIEMLRKIYNDVGMSLFSFLVWAIVADQQTGRIAINADYILPRHRLTILLVADIFVVFAAAFVSNKTSPNKEGQWPDVPSRWVDGFMILLTVFLFVAPLTLMTKVEPPPPPKVAKILYSVTIPYVDSSIPAQLGPKAWANRTLCETFLLQADDPQSARAAAKTHFEGSGRAAPLFSSRSGKVTQQDACVVPVGP